MTHSETLFGTGLSALAEQAVRCVCDNCGWEESLKTTDALIAAGLVVVFWWGLAIAAIWVGPLWYLCNLDYLVGDYRLLYFPIDGGIIVGVVLVLVFVVWYSRQHVKRPLACTCRWPKTGSTKLRLRPVSACRTVRQWFRAPHSIRRSG